MTAGTKHVLLRQVPYGFFGVTVNLNGEDHGMLVSWVSQASFTPPMVVIAVQNEAKTLPMIREARAFAVNGLSAGQQAVAEKLGRASAQEPKKLRGIKTKPGPANGSPILADVASWVECRLAGMLPAGDHTLVLGEVVGSGADQDAEPMTAHDTGLLYDQ